MSFFEKTGIVAPGSRLRLLTARLTEDAVNTYAPLLLILNFTKTIASSKHTNAKCYCHTNPIALKLTPVAFLRAHLPNSLL